jgi:hypothetical protein
MWKVCGKPLMGALAGRKRKGNVIDWMGSLLLVLAITLLVLAYMNFMAVFNIKEDVKQLSREYMLRVETVGYLTPQDEAALTADLQALGVTGISLSGTTRGTPAGYGNRVSLVISCSIPGDVLNMHGDLFRAAFESKSWPVKVTRLSTAKW